MNQKEIVSSSLLSKSSGLEDNNPDKRNGMFIEDREKNADDFVFEANGKAQNAELVLDLLGPETPATRPHVPHFKRIQNISDFEHISSSFILGSNKRQKPNEELPEKEVHDEKYEISSKFEWLNPSTIRDANGRRPNDPLYDQRTLYIPSDSLKKMSASQRQYWSVKCNYLDVVLFFKVGKFYELYELDAEIGQRELDWKMTVSGVGKCRQVGISEAGIDDAVDKLVARGYKVGRMEQVETSDQAKARGKNSVIERKLVLMATPSTAIDGSMGPDAVHLLALNEGQSNNGSTVYGFAFLDYAALKFWVGSFIDDGSYAALGALLVQVSPREVLYEKSGLSKETHKALMKYASKGSITMQMTPIVSDQEFLDAIEVKKRINSHGYFRGTPNPWTTVIENEMHYDHVLSALGVLIGHVNRLKLDDALCNGELLSYHLYKGCLRLDGQALVNLEIFGNNFDGGLSGTLYKHLDHCRTTSGKRLLRRWICHPLKQIDDINDRLNVVEGLINNPEVIAVISQYLCKLPDLDRLLGRVNASVGSSYLLLLPSIGAKMLKQQIKTFGLLIKGLRMGMDLLMLLQKEHKVSFLSKVVNLHLLSGLDELLKQFEAAMSEVFPCYQDHDAKESDGETLSVLIEKFVGKAADWSQVIHTVNRIDVLQSFAASAITSAGSMCRPVFMPTKSSNSSRQGSGGSMLCIKGLWHPYAVGNNENGQVPNDINLGEGSEQQPCALLLTGPNMGGKSTLLRATCLAVILAQLGCYVPADKCMLTPADVIFTRLGATDRIMSGESTFFVECSETASVLRNATQDSLVLLDELGRGTSTFDGYAIAYAVFRHLVESIRCRLLFATHYHPLTKEFASHPRVNLQHMACTFDQKINGEQELVFLYRLASGSCPESYGLQAALIAGIPKSVVDAASTAGERMKLMISGNFKSSERRSEFSTLHEEWLKSILSLSRSSRDCWDEDTSDTMLCLWHEIRSSYR
ncbi:DNA mismatch repair protein MSH7 isoform X2 [Phalaenopsis equestris]|uniref:DNA mismatch repair protein MSH7 isoform X2 n=1 Tax=Phalaenopsis equestris TaxID=78828 RepID=UPI0009E1A628|nr:DNA mismatch repair protein MSH7 isoform X2 [Phalaenopsis equestris]